MHSKDQKNKIAVKNSAFKESPVWQPKTSKCPFQTSKYPFQTSKHPFQTSKYPLQTSKYPFLIPTDVFLSFL